MYTALLTVFLLAFSSSMAEKYKDEALIKNFLKKLEADGYDKHTPPIGRNGPGSPVDVAISAHILDIEKVNDVSMGFKAHFYFRQHWNDSRLIHSEDIGILKMRDEKSIWNPDLFFVDAREGSIHQIMQPNKFVVIQPDGKVLYSARIVMEFSCPMDLRNFPHDIQKCTIDIESYGFQRTELFLKWYQGHYKPVSAAEEMSQLEFDLTDIQLTSSTESVSTGEYGRLQIHLTFKRKFGFFATKLYVPFIILVIMSSLSLWIKAEEKCLRLCLILVVLYLMLKLSSDINCWIPASPYTKAIDVWIAFCDSLVFAVFLEFIVVAGIVGLKNNKSNREELLLPTLNPLSKEIDTDSGSQKTPHNKFIRMFEAGRGDKNDLNTRIDKISRIVFPVVFILFNIIYWPVFCCSA